MGTCDYPEHEKLKRVSDQSQTCGEFYEWLMERFTLATWRTHNDDGDELLESYLMTAHPKTQDLLAEFFEIDQNVLEQEKRVMIEEAQNHGGARHP